MKTISDTTEVDSMFQLSSSVQSKDLMILTSHAVNTTYIYVIAKMQNSSNQQKCRKFLHDQHLADISLSYNQTNIAYISSVKINIDRTIFGLINMDIPLNNRP